MKVLTTALQMLQCGRNTQLNNVRFLPGTITHALAINIKSLKELCNISIQKC